MLASFSSAFDPSETSDSSLDPLGLYAFSDALASRFIPGLRERMSTPRFLTAIAFGAYICAPFRGRVAKDGRSEPYQVYEWLMVTGWYKVHRDTEELLGLPGVQKAEEAFRQSKPLNAARYLKTASVFGFHGVYRTLAEEIGVVDEAYQLGPLGEALLQAWERGMGLSLAAADWQERLKTMRADIDQSLNSGHVNVSWHNHRVGDVANHFLPHRITPEEADVIWRGVLSGESMRGSFADFMTKDGGAIWNAALEQSKVGDERKVYEAFQQSQNAATGRISIQLVRDYERAASTLHEAFHAILRQLELTSPVSKEQLVALPEVYQGAIRIADEWRAVCVSWDDWGRSHDTKGLALPEGLQDVLEVRTSVQFIEMLWTHHSRIQKKKGRQGKMRWLERDDHGRFHVSLRGRSEEPRPGSFVHAYRCVPMMSFIQSMNRG
jgi:hypothetical protein